MPWSNLAPERSTLARLRWFAMGMVALVLFASSSARAQAAPPAGHSEIAFDFMNLLSQHGLHTLDNERWNAYGQVSLITNSKLPFAAPYTNANGTTNSLLPGFEQSFTTSFTLFLGARLWPGAEAYFVPEVIAERPLSGLHGIGGSIQNFELQKSGAETPALYRARLFLRQNLTLGGEPAPKDSDPLQLGTTTHARRVTVTLGNFSSLDVFDRNTVTADPRQTFFNMAFMTHASWDFAADARGYSWGLALELYWDQWVLRVGRMLPPKNPNTLPIDFRFWQYFSDTVELEHDHELFGLPGAIRVLAYRNRVFTGSFNDAVTAFTVDPSKNAAACTTYNYGSQNAQAPDLCWVRKDNIKVGIGLNLEQFVAQNIGVFVRAMYSDGLSEVDAFNPADASLSFGSVAKGSLWARPFDVAGVGFALSWISAAHARYLALGGVDGFVGDGHLRRAPECVFEVFYSFNLFRAVWLAADYQALFNPGFNADRGGPVHILGAKVHAEF